MGKNKRQRENNSGAQGPPRKKQAIYSSVARNPHFPRTHPSSKSHIFNSQSKGHKLVGTDGNNPVPDHIQAEDESIREKSGYESLDLLEEALMNPSKVHVPSSLPSVQPLPQVRNGSDGDLHQNGLPALPEIQDSQFADAPFTHRGTSGEAAKTHRDVPSMNYERLEFLGDAYLELIASRVILPRFPGFDPGRLSQTRQLLVCNETLANFSERYGFDTRARLPPGIQRKKGSQEKAWIKVMGDIFEAYVAALILSDPENGHSTAEKWLIELWEPLLQRQVNPEVADPMAKQLLATKIMTKGTKINYRDAGLPEQSTTVQGRATFFIDVFYTGLGFTDFYLGNGKGASKAEAGYDAATNALRHPRIGEIMMKKKEFDLQSKAKGPQNK
ncbi:MAG: hypothetical protein Q9216_000126 [Gyalolechia sp. 2 TL-2023]